jgi:hypothetical protein
MIFSDGGRIRSLLVAGVGMPAERRRSVEAFDNNNAMHRIELRED